MSWWRVMTTEPRAIQLGESVYWQGDVWTVVSTPDLLGSLTMISLERFGARGRHHMAETTLDKVQRVEQVQ